MLFIFYKKIKIVVCSLVLGGALLSFDHINAFANEVKEGTVTASYLNIRSLPNTQSNIIGTLKQGSVIQPNSSQNGWTEFIYNGKKGYVSTQYIKIVTKQTTSLQNNPTQNTTYAVTSGDTLYSIAKKFNTSVDKIKTLNKLTNDNLKVGQKLTISATSTSNNTTTTNPSTPTTSKKVGYITASSLNVRSSKTLTAGVIGQLSKNSKVEIVSVSGDWGQIVYNGKIGYISMTYVSLSSQPPTTENTPTTTTKKGTVTVSSLNVRSAKTLTASVIGQLLKNQTVEIVSVSGDWGQIVYNGKAGYISMSYVSLNSQGTTENNTTTNVKKGTVNTSSLNVRKNASINSQQIGTLNKGSQVEIIETIGSWYKINFNNSIGYVSSIYVTLGDNIASAGSLSGKTIVVDAGHGGKDPGAVSDYAVEKSINFGTALKVKNELEKLGARVVMTRSTDVFLELGEITTISNNSKGDAFISVHTNTSSSSSATGIESYYYTYGSDYQRTEKSRLLAQSVQSNMMSVSNAINRGVKSESLYVLRNNNLPSTLIEVGFLSNQYEASLITSNNYQDKLAKAIAKGVSEYFN